MNRIIFFLSVVFAPLQHVMGQSDLRTTRFVSLSCDNDYFFWFGYSNDRYYSAGNSISYGFGADSKSKFVNALFPTIYSNTSIFNLRIIQQINTPTYLNSVKLYTTDYPFAAALYATVSRNTLSREGDARWKTEFQLGVMGPSALGKEMQTWTHQLTNSSPPYGWINQIPDELILNYNIEYDRKICSLSSNKHVLGNLQTAFGTLSSQIQAGISLNVFNKSGLIMGDYTLWPSDHKWTLLCSIAPALRAVFWNSMLQGSPFDNHEHFYHVRSSSMTHILPMFLLNLTVARGRHQLHGQQTFMYREFKTVDPQVYGTITYSIRFGKFSE